MSDDGGGGVTENEWLRRRLRFDRPGIESSPNEPGVHVVWDPGGAPLYVGESGQLRSRMLQHLSGDRGSSILHSRIGERLDATLARPATAEDIRDYLKRCEIAWTTSLDRAALKGELMDELQPALNEIRPHAASDPIGTGWDEVPRMLQEVLAALEDRQDLVSSAAYDDLVAHQLPEAVRSKLPTGYVARGRTGMGSVAEVPWVGVFPEDTATAQVGVYFVYLFAADGSRVYLALNQGTEHLSGGLAPLQKRSLDVRDVLGPQPDLLTDISLGTDGSRPARYTAATAFATVYERDAIPDADALLLDLTRFVDMLSTVQGSGLSFHPDFEPVHLVMKWSAELNPATLAEHAKVAEEKGAVWWGKFGDQARSAIRVTRLDLVRSQLAVGATTHCYLYRKGEIWRTDLLEITADPDEVDESRLPGYYGTESCHLFALVTNFVQLDPDWAVANLLLASQPDPETIIGSLGNQTSPMLVYERWRGQDHGTSPTELPPHRPAPADELSLDWLTKETLWDRADLDEILAALDSRPQVILAGPPGTGKTWVAKHLARYITQDQALAYRVLQFHPSYGYEEFIEGLRPVVEAGAMRFDRANGAVLRMVELMVEGSGQRHVLILDEMNRANLPRVFGELMYALEYRGEAVDLMYSEDFDLPKELLFIGTMNTADRSIRSIDIAMRRRFEIFECFPDRAILERFYATRDNQVPDLLDGFDRLNTELTDLLDRHHTIGHTFFMADPLTPELLRATWQRQLAPLIEEYFFDQPDRVSSFQVDELWPSVGDATAH